MEGEKAISKGRFFIMNAYIENNAVFPAYFVSANSAKGFINDFQNVFGKGHGVDHLYIIKGGPGTGKSYFMRKTAQYAAKKGYHVTYYHCSSDPTSLDGIRLEKDGCPTWGLIDGTPPHTWEADLPGAREEIVNLGTFWDVSCLSEKKEDISRYICQKSQCYARAYRYLGAYGEVICATEALTAPCIRTEALKRYAERILRHTPSGKSAEETGVHLRAVSMSGEAYLDTFEKLARKQGGEILLPEEYYGLGYALTAQLYAISKQNGYRMVVSRHPILPHRIDGLYYPDTGHSILVVPHGAESATDTVSVRRYMDHTLFRSVRGEVRHDLHLADALTERALQSLREAGEYHFALEKIYASSMNFQAKEKFENDFLKALFS